MRTHSRRRRGFVLMSVLWVVVGVSLAATAALIAAREAVATSLNRQAMTESEWHAEECIERARALIGAALSASTPPIPGVATWSMLDSALTLAGGASGPRCVARLEPVGVAVNVNDADYDQIRRVLLAGGKEDSHARALVDAALDWRDADHETRPAGGERDWYVAAGKLQPRNGPFASIDELRQVRGFDDVQNFTTETGRICLNHAPAPVLASLPGFGAEIVEHVVGRRAGGVRVVSLIALAGEVSSTARDSIIAHFPELSSRTTIEPDAWLLIATGTAGSPLVTTTIELKLANAGLRAAIIRRRML